MEWLLDAPPNWVLYHESGSYLCHLLFSLFYQMLIDEWLTEFVGSTSVASLLVILPVAQSDVYR